MAEEVALIVVDMTGMPRTADSKNEVYFAMALTKLKIPFYFQYTIYGGTSRRGGLIVDFVARAPFVKPILIQGKYWHRDASKERLTVAAIEQFFKTKVVLITEEESATEEAALRAARAKVL